MCALRWTHHHAGMGGAFDPRQHNSGFRLLHGGISNPIHQLVAGRVGPNQVWQCTTC